MKDLTKYQLRRLAEQMLRIIRDDEEISEQYVSISATKEGYMSFMCTSPVDDAYDETRLPKDNHWHNFSDVKSPLITTETYKCFDCKHGGSLSDDGGMICRMCMCEVESTGVSCDKFEDNFYSSKSSYRREK